MTLSGNMTAETTILYRPVGPKELALIAASGFRKFPPRLPEQPIFYPVLNEEYARQIARDWNVRDSGAGYVTRFAVRAEFLAHYPPQQVGAAVHRELWIPAEDLSNMNENIVGLIEVIAEYKQMKRILFYSVREPYGEFSNFSPHPIKVNGQRWPTSEHFFQAQKFAGTKHEEEIRRAKAPMIAARLGRNRKWPLRRDWEGVKEEVMRKALHAKFTQHEELKKLLLNTADAVLVEHTANDSYWADNGDGTGKNRLGALLMELREQLRNEKE
jgi:N-glycosidase YbiA